MSQGRNFPIEMLSTDASRVWTLVSTCRSWLSSHRPWDVNKFSKQSTSTSAFSYGWCVIPKGSSIGLVPIVYPFS
jgi:hypothetical protein